MWGNILCRIGVENGTHRRLIFSGATMSRFTRQICDHKMSNTKSNTVHRKTSDIIIGTFIGSAAIKQTGRRNFTIPGYRPALYISMPSLRKNLFKSKKISVIRRNGKVEYGKRNILSLQRNILFRYKKHNA